MIRILLFTVFILVSFLQPIAAQKKGHSKTEVIAYYAGSGKFIDSFQTDKLTQIIYSFAHLKGNKLFISNARDTATIQKLVALKNKNKDLKVLLSLGGWGGCAPCSDVFSTKEGRDEFAASVKELQLYFQTDGIDLDWEYPTIEGYPGHTFQQTDKKNFTELLKSLRKTLGKKSIISFAAGGFDTYLEKSVEWKKVIRIANNVNLMSYDLVSGYSKVTGHHTALYSTAQQKQSADNAVQFFRANKIPLNKIIIGAAFYARTWVNVDSVNNGLYRSGNFQNMISYSQFDRHLSTDSGYIFYKDSSAAATFAYNKQTKTFATFDDPYSITEKVNYIKKNKLGGIMFWALPYDHFRNGLLDVIDQAKKNQAENR